MQVPSSGPRSVRHALSLDPQRQRLLNAQGETVAFPTDGSTFSLGEGLEGQWRGGRLCQRKEGSEFWTPVNNGQVVADQRLTLTGPEAGSPSDRPLHITFFGDATSSDIGRHVKAQPARMQDWLSQSKAPVSMTGLLAGAAEPPTDVKPAGPSLLLHSLLASAGSVALGVGLGASLPLVITAGVVGALGGLFLRARRLGAERAQPMQGLQASKVRTLITAAPPRTDQFRQLWQANLKSWPQARHLIYFSGHGQQNNTAGLALSRLAGAARGAEALVMDSCNGGQLESLIQVAEMAKVAVVSEHVVQGYGFPMEKMFNQEQFPQDSRAFAAELVQAASASCPGRSLVGVDLEVLKSQLFPSLDRLGRSLSSLRGEYGDSLSRMLTRSETTDASKERRHVDLGSFLAQLQSVPGLAEDCPELAVSQKALNSTILSMVGHGTLSFDREAPSTLPPGWRKFLKQFPLEANAS